MAAINWDKLANPRDASTVSSSQVLLRTPHIFPLSPLRKTNQSLQGHYGLLGIMGTWVLIHSHVVQGFTAEVDAVNVLSGPVLSQPGANIPQWINV